MHKFAGMRVADILRTKKGSIRLAPLPTGSLTWSEFELLMWEQIEEGAPERTRFQDGAKAADRQEV